MNLPPRVGKTVMMAALVCWVIAFFPHSQCIYTSYAATLAEATLAYIADTLRRDWFLVLFGDLVHGKRADYVTTIEGGSIYAVGVGGALTGRGAGSKEPGGGLAIIDDAAKPDEALSPVAAENVRHGFVNTILSRRNSSEYTPIIICAQRLAPLDLPGYLLENYGDRVFHIKFPAMVNGESQFPETISTATLLALQRTRTGRWTFAAQYQQEPVAIGGNLIVTDEFRWYEPNPSHAWARKIITCDTAFTKREGNDFCVLQCWGQLEGTKNAHLLDQARGRWDSPALLSNAALFWQKHNEDAGHPVSKFLIEEATAGHGLMQQLAQLGIPTVGLRRIKDKAARVQDVLPYISTGLVYLPKGEPFIEELLAECGAFTQNETHAHDDQVDCLVDGIQEIMIGGETGVLDWGEGAWATVFAAMGADQAAG
ncbi:MAG TPA: phage terminase large subunit [Opitutaceae bacterium]|nr:phage terminase large subunit [Opitutaceae bacterium]